MDDLKSFEVINILEQKIGVSTGFFNTLLKEDDWTFIVKLHALIEASITHLLSETISISMSDYSKDINKQSLTKVLSWTELSNKRTGKTAIAHSLGLILDYQREFIYYLSDLRNILVHDVKNASFKLNDYVTGLETQRRKNFILAFNSRAVSDMAISNLLKRSITKDKFTIENPKFAIWLTSLISLEEIHYCIEAFSNHLELNKLLQEKSKMLDSFSLALQDLLPRYYQKF